MTIRDALIKGNLPRLESEILLAHVLKKERSWLLAHDEEQLTEKQMTCFKELIQKRSEGMPIAYVTGIKEFYGREFAVRSGVLIPRPSTEILIAETIDYLQKPENRMREADSGISVLTKKISDVKPKAILDIGTGSGIIGITLLQEGWVGQVMGIDVSDEALSVAKENAIAHRVLERFHLKKAQGYDAILEQSEPFLVVSNPPYIPTTETLMRDVMNFEPHQALFGGADGLDVIREIIEGVQKNPHACGILLELRTDQCEAVYTLLGG